MMSDLAVKHLISREVNTGTAYLAGLYKAYGAGAFGSLS